MNIAITAKLDNISVGVQKFHSAITFDPVANQSTVENDSVLSPHDSPTITPDFDGWTGQQEP